MDEALEQGVRDLLDKQAIQEVCLRYARGIELSDPVSLASAFHDDAVYEHFQSPPRTADGDAAAMAARMVQSAIDSPLRRKVLMISPSMIELDGDQAFGETHGLSFNILEEGGQQTDYVRTLRWLDRFERRDGTWRIAHRIILHGGHEHWRPAEPSPLYAGFPSTGMSGRYPDDALYSVRERFAAASKG